MEKPKRALVIGLDGATFRLIEPLVEAGRLPNLAKLMAHGVSGPLRSTIQPSSEQAWATFMTGQNNGKHGVFSFLRRQPDSYRFDYVNGSSIRARTLWRILSQRGRRIIAINVPMTYPPRPVNGVLIGGLLSPGEDSRFTYPEGIYDELCAVCGDYRITLDIERGRLNDAQLARLADDATRMIRLRTCATLHLARTRPWDCLMVVYGASDRLAHKFWKYWDEAHPLHTPAGQAAYGDVLPGIYEELDQAVGALLAELADEHTTVFVLSDHGFGPLEKAVYLNRWLARKGYLHLQKGMTGPQQQVQRLVRSGVRQAQGLINVPLAARFKKWAFGHFPHLKGHLYSSVAFAQVDWTCTRAYALGTMGNIYLNRHGREPEGIVTPGPEADRIVDQLRADLQELRDPESGEPVFLAVHRGRDLYRGPHVEEGPDIVALKSSRYHVVTAEWHSGDGIVVPLGGAVHFVSDQSGQHELDGVLIAHGPDIRSGSRVEGAHLIDMAATILYSLGEPIPEAMDSRALVQLFEEEFVAARPPQYCDEQGAAPEGPGAGDYSPDEEALLHKHLAGLGYLD